MQSIDPKPDPLQEIRKIKFEEQKDIVSEICKQTFDELIAREEKLMMEIMGTDEEAERANEGGKINER